MTIQPPFQPPQMPPQQPRWPLVLIGAIAATGIAAMVAGAILVVNSEDGKDTTPSPPVSATPTSAEPRISVVPQDSGASGIDESMTELITDLAWDDMTESERTDMCVSIEMLGTGWAADTMRENQSDDPEIDTGWEVDWDLAAEHIEAKCTEQGF